MRPSRRARAQLATAECGEQPCAARLASIQHQVQAKKCVSDVTISSTKMEREMSGPACDFFAMFFAGLRHIEG